MARPILKLKQIIKRHQQGGVLFELEMPEFVLSSAQFVAIVGESGCGKSTLLDLLALISKPAECEQFIYYDTHQDIDLKALWTRGDETQLAILRRAHFGYVLQTGGLLPFLTVAQNLTLPLTLNGQSSQYLNTWAERLGIHEVLDKKPQYLSGGQRQRAAVLRALLHNPRVVLADEPTGAVDKPRARQIVAQLAELTHERDCALVMVTHDQDLVENVADVTYSFAVETVSDNLTRSRLYPVSANGEANA